MVIIYSITKSLSVPLPKLVYEVDQVSPMSLQEYISISGGVSVVVQKNELGGYIHIPGKQE